MSRKLHVFVKDAAVTATLLHDGTNGQGYPNKMEGFVVQAIADTHFGTSSVTGTADGFTIAAGESVNLLGFLSRGSPEAYDLSQMYYIGGPWKLVIEEQT